MITENQEGFIRILNEPDASDSAPAPTTGGAGGPAVSRDQVWLILRNYESREKLGGPSDFASN